MRLSTLLTALPLFILGCSQHPVVIKEPVEVKVPVAVPCEVQLPDRPVWAMDTPGLKKENILTKGVEALREVEQRHQYEIELEAALKACTKK